MRDYITTRTQKNASSKTNQTLKKKRQVMQIQALNTVRELDPSKFTIQRRKKANGKPGRGLKTENPEISSEFK